MKRVLFLMVWCVVSLGASGLKVGDTIPKLSLPTHQGKKVDVNGFAKSEDRRNLLFVFFRTGTCAVCIQQLQEFSQILDKIHGLNASVLAISMDDAIVHARTSEKIQGKIPLLLDPGGKTIQAFGVMNPSEKLAFPSLFLVGPDQKVLYKYVGRGLRDRPPLEEVTKVLRHYSGLVPTRTSAK